MNNKKKIIIINLFLFALLFGLISLNKEIIRPLYSHTPLMKILTGSFPNFIAAYIISTFFINGIITSGIITKKKKKGRLIVYLASVTAFLLLAIAELKPFLGISIVSDNYDIIASGLGSLLGVLTFEIIIFIKSKKDNFSN